MATLRQRRGSAAEDMAAEHLVALGWRVVARNVRVERDEVDIVAIDAGPPPELVCVEVRSATSAAFGAPEERVDRLKVRRLYRGMLRLATPAGLGLPRRVDLIIVDRRRTPARIRHLRRLEVP
jgi:putative endonuclease